MWLIMRGGARRSGSGRTTLLSCACVQHRCRPCDPGAARTACREHIGVCPCAIGVGKALRPNRSRKGALEEIGGGFDRFDQQRWTDEYRALAARAEVKWSPGSRALDRNGHLWRTSQLSHASLRHDARADRDCRREKPLAWLPEPESSVPLPNHEGRGVGGSAGQRTVDARHVLR